MTDYVTVKSGDGHYLLHCSWCQAQAQVPDTDEVMFADYWFREAHDHCEICGATGLLTISPAYWLADDGDGSPPDGDPSVDVKNDITAQYCPVCRELTIITTPSNRRIKIVTK